MNVITTPLLDTRLPQQLSGPGRLHLRFPLIHARHKVVAYLREADWQFEENDGTLTIIVPDPDLTLLVLPLLDVLSSPEQAEVRALFQREGQELALKDYFDIGSLQCFAARALGGWLIETMQQDRLTTVFQPIIECESGRVFGYECLLRSVHGDRVITPNRILDIARGAGLLYQLDLLARLNAIREAARFGIQHKIFINFTPIAMQDPAYGLRSTVQAVDECGLRRDQIVFEVIESELIHDVGYLREVLGYYRDCGFGVALDDLGSGYSSLNLLGQLRPDYVKLDRELMHNVHDDPYKSLIAQKLLETATALNIKTIAEGIETEGEHTWLQSAGSDYAQGYHFARPGTPPPLLQPFMPELEPQPVLQVA